MQEEPRVQEEPPIEVLEPPIEASWEFANVRVEKVESPHYSSIPSPAQESAVSIDLTSPQPDVSHPLYAHKWSSSKVFQAFKPFYILTKLHQNDHNLFL